MRYDDIWWGHSRSIFNKCSLRAVTSNSLECFDASLAQDLDDLRPLLREAYNVTPSIQVKVRNKCHNNSQKLVACGKLSEYSLSVFCYLFMLPRRWDSHSSLVCQMKASPATWPSLGSLRSLRLMFLPATQQHQIFFPNSKTCYGVFSPE